MSIQLVITSQDAGSAVPLQVEVSGYRLELSGIALGRKLAIGEDCGKITVSLDVVAVVEAVQPSAEVQCAALQPHVIEAQPEAAAVVEPEEDKAAQAEKAASTVVELSAGQASQVHESAAAEQLFQQLVSLRKKISAEVKLPPYIIFHDSTLKDMCRLLPADLQALGTIQGVGKAKLEKYGSRFIEAIREYAAVHCTKGAA